MKKMRKVKYIFPALLLLLSAAVPLGTVVAGAEETAEKAGVKSVSCSAPCWEGQDPSNLTDDSEDTFMNPTSKTYTVKIELNGYYHLTGFRWFPFEGFYPEGDISVSLNGGGFEKWADFAFEYIEDPTYGAGYEMVYSGEAYAKYLLVNVTGGPQASVATRDFSIYGTAYTPDRVDPEGLIIAEKNQDGAYNTASTACSIGDTFTLTAVQDNPNSIEKVVWKSNSAAMITVDEFGKVTINRGGIQPYYTVTATVVAPNGTAYSDEIKIYVKPIANIATAGKLSYSNVDYYWLPQMAFDGVTSVFGNWVQPTDSVSEYYMACSFDQEIKFGKAAIHIAVNPPKEIEVLGKRANGSYETVQTFKNIRAQSVLELTGEWEYYGFRFNVKETGTYASTIYDIQIFNHEDFSLADIKQATDVTENRGPLTGVYEPEIVTGESASNSYGEKFTPSRADAAFSYVEESDGAEVALCIVSCVLGAGIIGIAVLYGLTINHKKRK